MDVRSFMEPSIIGYK